MKKTSTLQQKLKSYSAVAGAVTAATAIASDAQAQVIYTDVTPDAVVNVSGTKYDIDLNGSVVDFSVAFSSGTYAGYAYNYCVAYTTMGATNQIDTLAGGGGSSAAHNINDNISSSNLWNIGFAGTGINQHLVALTFPAISYNIGSWVGVSDKYLAVKFDISGATHYGWVRMTVSGTSNSITVKDMAYNATPNTAILAGAMPSGVADENLEASTSIFASEDAIIVKLINHTSVDGFVTVTNVLGNVVAKVNITNETTQIDLNNSTSGIYFATVTKADGNSFTKKLYVK